MPSCPCTLSVLHLTTIVPSHPCDLLPLHSSALAVVPYHHCALLHFCKDRRAGGYKSWRAQEQDNWRVGNNKDQRVQGQEEVEQGWEGDTPVSTGYLVAYICTQWAYQVAHNYSRFMQ